MSESNSAAEEGNEESAKDAQRQRGNLLSLRREVLYRFQGSRKRKLNNFSDSNSEESERKRPKRNATKLPVP